MRVRDLNRKIRKADRVAMRLNGLRTLTRIALGAHVGESAEGAVTRLIGERRLITAKLHRAKRALELAL